VLTLLAPDASGYREWEHALKCSAREAGYTGGTHLGQELQDVPLDRPLR
jgi:hypothetical protein